MLSVEEAAAAAMELPEVTEGLRFRNRTWFVAGKGFAWERPFSKADIRRFGSEPVPAGPILATRVADLAEKDATLAAHPDCCFTIPHFDGYAAVLTRLDAAPAETVRTLLVAGWLACAPPALADQLLG